MTTYNSFIFEGHGTSDKTGAYDPGAVSGNFRENDIADKIVATAMNYIRATGLSIHTDENNYIDDDLTGNDYTAKSGISVHVNAGGGTGVEIYVPSKEAWLTTDFQLAADISNLLGIPNRGIKSRDFTTEQTFIRTDGVALNYTDYYKEIRYAWSLGISLAIVEVGFIDSSDLSKINANIDGIGFLVAKYIAKNCGVDLQKPAPQPPTPTPVPPTPPAPSEEVFYRVVCGSFKDKGNAENRKTELESKGYSGVFIDIFKK